ncbi:MAG: hypothetical protein M3444_10510, partial [Acidobacteriota bacterium]|nr:hypothetical protein [Acidobacteriota bacterium]
PEVVAFAAEAEAAPPEVASDALIKLASSARAADPAWKRELIERAFVLAGTSRQHMRRKAAPYVSALADNSAEYLSQAYNLGLDALSLRVRAVRAMLPIDAPRAREMLAQIPAGPPLPALSCKDAMVYDVSDFYALAGEIALKTFSGEEVRQGARAHFVLPYVEAVSSPAQAVPAIRLVLAVGQRPEDMALLAPALAKAIRNLPADDRSFTGAASADNFAGAAGDLARALGKRTDALAGDFVEACRRFIRAGMTGERCAEDVPRRTPSYLSEANLVLFKSSPLKPENLGPSGVGARADISEYWKTPGAKALLRSFQRLRFGDDPAAVKISSEGTALTREDVGTPDWDAQLRRFLSDLESWDGSGEASEYDFFNQQQNLYQGLLEVAPVGQARSEVLASWLKSLGGGRDGEAELLRYFYASELLKAVNASPPAMRDDFLARMVYSNDAALSIFAKETRLKL